MNGISHIKLYKPFKMQTCQQEEEQDVGDGARLVARTDGETFSKTVFSSVFFAKSRSFLM